MRTSGPFGPSVTPKAIPSPTAVRCSGRSTRQGTRIICSTMTGFPGSLSIGRLSLDLGGGRDRPPLAGFSIAPEHADKNGGNAGDGPLAALPSANGPAVGFHLIGNVFLFADRLAVLGEF